MLTNMVRCLYDTPVPTMHTYQRYDCEELIFVYKKNGVFVNIKTIHISPHLSFIFLDFIVYKVFLLLISHLYSFPAVR